MDDKITGHGCTFIQVNWTFCSLISHSSQPFHQHEYYLMGLGGCDMGSVGCISQESVKVLFGPMLYGYKIPDCDGIISFNTIFDTHLICAHTPLQNSMVSPIIYSWTYMNVFICHELSSINVIFFFQYPHPLM